MGRNIIKRNSHSLAKSKLKKGTDKVNKFEIKEESDSHSTEIKTDKKVRTRGIKKGKPKSAKTKVKKGARKLRNFVKAGKKKLMNKIKMETTRDRGVVYLSHIPHGFYEDELKGFFSQFGTVTGVNMPHSETGKSRGYAFIEFQHQDVAKVAAETMNNYLMMGRLLKAEYIPPERQKPYTFRSKSITKQEAKEKRILKDINIRNKALTKEEEKKFIGKIVMKINGLKEQMKEIGLNYDIQVGYGSEAVLTNLKSLDLNEKHNCLENMENEKVKPLVKNPSKLEIATEKIVKGASSAVQKVKKFKKKVEISNEPKETMRRVKSLGGKIGKKVKKKITKTDIKRIKLETDV